MKPLRLRARNFRTFDALDLEFRTGLIGVLGELRDAPEGASSNGAGKSSLLEAIDVALFGRRSLAGYLTRGGDVDELMVELTFEHAGHTYRVRRTYSAKGRGKTSVDLEISHDTPHHTGDDWGPGWEPLTRASAKETDELLQEILGLSRDTFRDSSYLRQGDGGYADPDRDPKQRKQLLVEAVLGRDPVWPKLADHARARRKQNETVLERHRGETDRLAEQAGTETAVRYALSQAEQAVVTAQDAVSEAEKAHAAVAARYQAAREQTAARATVEAELAAARTDLARLEQLELAAGEAVIEQTTAREELATLATPEQTETLVARERELAGILDEHRASVAAHETATRERAAAVQRRDELLARAREAHQNEVTLRAQADAALANVGTAHCDRCQQILGSEAAQAAADSYRAEADKRASDQRDLDAQADVIEIPNVAELPEQPAGVDVELSEIRARIVKAHADAAQRARLEERLTQLDRNITARPPFDTVNAARDTVSGKERLLDDLEPVDVDAIAREGVKARAELEWARTAHTDAIAERARRQEQLATIETAKQKLTAIEVETSMLQGAIDRDLLLERAYGRDGIPALIIENTAIPAIEAEASRILRALGTSFDVQLRTQVENKSGGLRDTLDVVVIDQDGNEADYADGCSGGEQTRIGLALRIALARLLAHRRGAESRLLALDEPSYLDAAGMTALLDVLRGLDDEFDLILLVSHVAELRDALDETITVVKEAGRSSIAGDRATEAVAA